MEQELEQLQDKIDELEEKNKELEQENTILRETLENLISDIRYYADEAEKEL